MDKPKTRIDYMVRGILIGGSLGVIAGWFFIEMQRGLLLGGLVGALAGLTIHSKREKDGTL